MRCFPLSLAARFDLLALTFSILCLDTIEFSFCSSRLYLQVQRFNFIPFVLDGRDCRVRRTDVSRRKPLKILAPESVLSSGRAIRAEPAIADKSQDTALVDAEYFGGMARCEQFTHGRRGSTTGVERDECGAFRDR
ncbi:MAG TPA: hypothetical protein VMI32_07185 [Candidatus Solibacter sp.]|nr:hypothetical protein [Candidatus Solibacter sp.]